MFAGRAVRRCLVMRASLGRSGRSMTIQSGTHQE